MALILMRHRRAVEAVPCRCLPLVAVSAGVWMWEVTPLARQGGCTAIPSPHERFTYPSWNGRRVPAPTAPSHYDRSSSSQTLLGRVHVPFTVLSQANPHPCRVPPENMNTRAPPRLHPREQGASSAVSSYAFRPRANSCTTRAKVIKVAPPFPFLALSLTPRVVLTTSPLVPSIYKGLLPTVLKVSTAQATRFGVYQVLKSASWYGKDSTAKSAAAGAAAGAASVFAFQVRLRFPLVRGGCKAGSLGAGGGKEGYLPYTMTICFFLSNSNSSSSSDASPTVRCSTRYMWKGCGGVNTLVVRLL